MIDTETKLKQKGNRLIASYDYEQAISTFEQLIQYKPDSPHGFIGLAKAYSRIGEYHKVLDLLEPVVLKFNNIQMLRLLAHSCKIIINRGDKTFVDKALFYYAKYHEIQIDPLTKYDEGELYLKYKKDPEKALACYLASWEKEPRSKRAYQNALHCLRRLNREPEIPSLKQKWKELNKK